MGRGLVGQRDQVVVSTKAHPQGGGGPLTSQALRESVQLSLRRLQTDRVDVFHLHGVDIDLYEHCVGELVPELRASGLRGTCGSWPYQSVFEPTPATRCCWRRPSSTTCWDVVMVGVQPAQPQRTRPGVPTDSSSKTSASR